MISEMALQGGNVWLHACQLNSIGMLTLPYSPVPPPWPEFLLLQLKPSPQAWLPQESFLQDLSVLNSSCLLEEYSHFLYKWEDNKSTALVSEHNILNASQQDQCLLVVESWRQTLSACYSVSE